MIVILIIYYQDIYFFDLPVGPPRILERSNLCLVFIILAICLSHTLIFLFLCSLSLLTKINCFIQGVHRCIQKFSINLLGIFSIFLVFSKEGEIG